MRCRLTLLAVLGAVMFTGVCDARPRPRHGHCAPRHHHHHHHCRAGAFVGGVVGGMVGGLIYNSVAPRSAVVSSPVVVQSSPVVVSAPAPVVVQPAPVVVNQPVYQTQNVWVEGAYQDQVQANGTVMRVWVPGHYEQRTVQVR